MRQVVDEGRIRRLLHALADAARHDGRVYLTGGATAVLLGWRATTIDIDLKFVPDQDEVLRAIPELKERLQVNVELASPVDFIPVAPDWEDRSPFIERIRRLDFRHFDLYAQALAKLERGHRQDLADVREMVSRELIAPDRALAYLVLIEPNLYRYPAIDAPAFRRAVEDFFSRG
jgi:hypothetical protein